MTTLQASPQQSTTATPRTAFEWGVYADATLAGLCALLPVPLLDWWLETRFRARMPQAIAVHRGTRLAPDIVRALNASHEGCLMLGVKLLVKIPLELLERLFAKIFYVLAIKQAVDGLNYYWQRAFLLDYMLSAGHLRSEESALRARRAMDTALASSPTPLRRLAGSIVQSPGHLLRTVRRGLFGREAEVLPQERSFLRGQWSQYEAALRALALRYERAYGEDD